MARTAVEKEIDGQLYTINPMMPTKALKILHRLGRYLGEPLALAMSGEGDLLEQEINPEFVSKALRKLFDNMPEQELETLLKDLMNSVIHEGKRIAFDDHFSNYGLPHLFKLSYAVLEVNYGDFLDVLVENADAFRRKGQDTTPAS